MTGSRPKPLLPRLQARSVPVGNCVIWSGPVDRGGYGVIRYLGRVMNVHRAAWIDQHGLPPAGTPHVLHHCDNPRCWSNECLFLGTHADNMRDMAAKGRQPGRGGWSRCIRNHLYDEANTYVTPNGVRRCRACKRIANKSYRTRQKESQ